jgi:hypothetical protein
MSAPAPLVIRPVPIRDAFKSVNSTVEFAVSIVLILAGFGVLTAVQGDAIEGLIGAAPGVVKLAGDVLRSFQVKKAIDTAEAAVTPLDDPARIVDGQLVALIEDPAQLPGQHRL